MAGVEWSGGKSHGGSEAAAYLRHNDGTEENRERVKRAKEKIGEICHIQPEMSKYNYSLCNGVYKYEDAYKKYRQRLEEVRQYEKENPKFAKYAKDVYNKKGELIHKKGETMYYTSTRKNKDGTVKYRKGDPVPASNLFSGKREKERSTMQSVIIYIPEGLNYEQRKRWAFRAMEIMTNTCGKDNLIDAWSHEDERHKYIDPETGEEVMSRAHIHASFIPEVGGYLDGANFSNRTRIMMVNQMIEDMSVREFGVHFMTGEKYKSKETIQELKAKSAIAEAELEAAEKQQSMSDLIDAREDLIDDVATFKSHRDRLQDDVKQLESEKADAVNGAADAAEDEKAAFASLAAVQMQLQTEKEEYEEYRKKTNIRRMLDDFSLAFCHDPVFKKAGVDKSIQNIMSWIRKMESQKRIDVTASVEKEWNRQRHTDNLRTVSRQRQKDDIQMQ